MGTDILGQKFACKSGWGALWGTLLYRGEGKQTGQR